MSEINLQAKFDVSDVRKGAEEYIKSIKNVEQSTEQYHNNTKVFKGIKGSCPQTNGRCKKFN